MANAAPVISQATDIAVAGDATGAPLPLSGFSNDALDGNDPIIYTDNGQTVPFEQNFAVGFHAVTATVTNRSGQTTLATFTATIVDTTGTVPINIGQRTSFALPGFNLANTHVTRGSNNLFTFTDGLSTTLVQFDAGQNLSTTGFTFTNQTAHLSFDAGPTIRETNLVVAGTPFGASVTFADHASDTLDGNLPINLTENGQTAFSGETFAPGTHRIDAMATNRSGQTTTISFTITVIDTTGQVVFDAGSATSLDLPTFNPAATHATRGANNLFTFTDGPHTALVQFDPGRNLSQTGFSFASDNSGGTAIQLLANTGPTISQPSNQTIEATGPSGAVVQFSVTAQDPLDGSDPVVYRENGQLVLPGDTFAIGVHPIVATTVDRSGFSASSAFSISVRDTSPPAISTTLRTGFDYVDNLTLPVLDLNASGRGGAIVFFSSIISAFDTVDGSVTLTFTQNGRPLSQTQYSATPYQSTFFPGDNVVVATATDSQGNSSRLTFDVRVSDTLTPFLTVPNLYVSTNGAASAIPNLPASVPDLVYGSAPVTYLANGKQIAAGQPLAPGHYGIFGQPINPAGVPSYDRFEIFVSKSLKDFSAQPAGVYVDLSAGFDYRATSAGVGWTNPAAALATGATLDRFSGIADVVGSAYADRLYGTAGDNNFLPGAGSDIIYGNGGRDTVDYLPLKAGVYVDLADAFALKAKTANMGWQDPFYAETGGYDTDYLGNITNVLGTNFDDRFYGRAGGGTTFSPGLGNDIIYGSGSNNTVDYSTSGDAIYADLAAGYALKLTDGGWRTDVVGILDPYTGSFHSSRAGPNGQNLAGGYTDSIYGIQNIVGSAKDDRFYGTSGDNVFTPGAGNDIVYGQGGNDTVSYSTLSAGVYVDLAARFAYKATNAGVGWTDPLVAEASGYTTDSLNGISNVTGTAFSDRLYGTNGNTVFAPGTGADIIYGQGGVDTVDYSGLNAGVYVDLAARFAYKATNAGVGWTDPLVAEASGYTTDSLNGISNVTGTAFSDRLYGTNGNTVFAPGTGADIIYGQGGVDTVDYSGLNAGVYVDLAARFAYKATNAGVGWTDPLVAEASGYTTDSLNGISNVTGTAFSDRLYGPSSGGATLSGGDGADIIYGQGGGNIEMGGNGNDRLVASGNDTMTGGTGADRFYFTALAQGNNTITDFMSGTDSLWFNSGQFGAYALGQSPSLSEGTGTSEQIFGTQTSQGFAYNTQTGALYFDADGFGGAAAVLVATLTGAPTLATSDLYIS